MSKIQDDFNRTLERKFSKAYASQSMLDWIKANTTLNGMPFATKGYEFQDTIINDMHPNLDCIKCSQVGLTELQIRKALGFVNRNRGTSAIFTLPNEDLFRRISQTRIKPIVDRDKVFNLDQDENSVRSMKIYQFDTSFLHVTACTEGDATSTSADAIFNDEVDLSPPDMLALFNSRLQNSEFKISQRFSTPTFQSHGIETGYQASDQRKYLHKCSSCNHWNWPEFDTRFCTFPDLPAHIEDLLELDQAAVDEMDLSQCFVACEKCGSKLQPDAPREWVASFPGRVDARGYWVSPFSTSRIPLAYIVGQLLKYKQRDFLRGFHNTVLGKTFSDAQTQIPTECIEKAMSKGTPNILELPKDRPLSLGMDMGQTCHLVVGDALSRKIMLMESMPAASAADRVAYLCKNYKVVSGAVDRLPYTPTADEIRRRTNNVVVPVQYVTTADSDMKIVLDKYEQLSHTHMNRTKILDEVAAGFRNYEFELSGYGYQRAAVIEHYRNMVRVESPEKPAVWEKLSGSSTMDHYFHATALYLAAGRLHPLIMEFLNGGVGDAFGFGIATMGGSPSLPGIGGNSSTRQRFG